MTYKIYDFDDCEIKTIGTDDINIISEFCRRCSDYYVMHGGIEASRRDVEEIFEELPPGKDYGDKFVFGIFKNNKQLVGIVDIVKDFPVSTQWMLGLMLIDPMERGRGLGRMVHFRLTEWAVNLGAGSFRIGVIDKNVKGIGFWKSLGYREIRKGKIQLKDKTNQLYVMVLNL
ncbi:MAG: GNAT family N-acetyltransferase [Clostridium sp.]|jgi:RimJ/RimL family protein N-acetyltransferase|uniref:GNAT family N-acetyltransferase n=1 Tax=Clostridium sp. TaxID=1506 RepID=UPI0025C6D92A|nr:GNAT family N-acetyltransferase [Clostridium sp.]MCH3963649.1 GNAT family N-acetyltransferase [Clostridium sp.]MCI1714790.1 GNAT family N-acetyltransferase [Clostridium sp.]MCI1799021.1 GNAT family N-acetyltransferase [Clostridium sp.]MCI1812973.1 GNAT family N-acetyltransferase [Clostridium sp.]MCI1869863.1 GNAT family N-acetyltransferase [Clostridium sp.]